MVAMDLFELINTLVQLVYCLVLIFLAFVVLLWMIGRAKVNGEARNINTVPFHSYASDAHGRLFDYAARRAPGYHSPSALTPTIDVPPRRLSFSATTPGPAPGFQSISPRNTRGGGKFVAQIPRRVTFSLTPSQESNERRLQSRDVHRAPYRSPGPDVQAVDEQFPSSSHNPPLIELYPSRRIPAGGKALIPTSGTSSTSRGFVDDIGAKRTLRHNGPYTGQSRQSHRGSAQPAKFSSGNEFSSWLRPKFDQKPSEPPPAPHHRTDTLRKSISSVRHPADAKAKTLLSSPRKTVPDCISARLYHSRNSSPSRPEALGSDQKENAVMDSTVTNTSRHDALAGVSKSWIPLDASQRGITFQSLSRFERKARGLEPHDSKVQNSLLPKGDEQSSLHAAGLSHQHSDQNSLDSDSPPSIIPLAEPVPMSFSHTKRVRFSFEGDETQQAAPALPHMA